MDYGRTIMFILNKHNAHEDCIELIFMITQPKQFNFVLIELSAEQCLGQRQNKTINEWGKQNTNK